MEKLPVPVVIVAGIEKSSRAIGFENKLLWHVPDDLKRFKALTFPHPVIMGRKTFESIVAILGKPLPGRTNIVITRNPDYSYPDESVKVASALEAAFVVALEESPTEIHIGGGAQALPYVSRLNLTFFDDPLVKADTFFPDFSPDFTIVKIFPEAEYEGLVYQWVDFDRLS
jgi:dihydrofolate reductase